ncbi:glutamyl-tRNA(Gln) amidotransferase subunit C-3, mitochondrial-like [Dysidea avara]|uniref:glutamyl-tRNA(Gln) amidotransferase subunit C-3, mitochondrial-like n=1 Tax=Dysidea avara TaxID=196820 RepID=UPI00332047DB
MCSCAHRGAHRLFNLYGAREPCRYVRRFIQTFHLYKGKSEIRDSSAGTATSAESSDSRKQQMDEIVRHMQVLALLRNPSKDGAVHGEEEQVEYLLSAMDIADKLMEVDTDGVEPLHSVLENEVTYLRPDKPLVVNETPPIPATKVSRRVTKEATDNQDEEF